MSLTLYRRGGVYHYRGTVGPRGKRKLMRGSCSTANKDIAARQIAEIEANYWKGNFDGPGSVLTFRQAAALYRGAGKPNKFLDVIEAHFKDTLVKDISKGAIQMMAQELYPGCTAASQNRLAITPAQAVINFAAESELCAPIRVPRFKEEQKVKTPATLEWVHAFMAEASDHLGTFALFMYLTGARPSEAIGLQWTNVDLIERTALIRENKVAKERLANLPAPLVAALANLTRVEGRGVFVYKSNDDLDSAWDAAIVRAKIKRLTPHCCRHGFATDLLRKGVDVVTVAWLGGWTNAAQVLKTYGHANKNPKLNELLVAGTDLTQNTAENARNLRLVGTS